MAPSRAVACDRETGARFRHRTVDGGSKSDRPVCVRRGKDSRGEFLASPRGDVFEVVPNWLMESFTRGELGSGEAPALEDLLEGAPLTAIWRFKRSL